MKRKLTELREAYGFLRHSPCTEEEENTYKEKIQAAKKDIFYMKEEEKRQILPEDVEYVEEKDGLKFVRVTDDTRISFEERLELLSLLQTEHLRKIERYVLFFVVLACIGIAAGIIAALNFSV